MGQGARCTRYILLILSTAHFMSASPSVEAKKGEKQLWPWLLRATEAFILKDNPTEALRLLKEAKKKNHRNELIVISALIALDNHEPELAWQQIQRALNRPDANEYAYYWAFRITHAKGNTKQAKKYLNIAQSFNSNHKSILFALIKTASSKKERATAARKLLSLRPFFLQSDLLPTAKIATIEIVKTLLHGFPDQSLARRTIAHFYLTVEQPFLALETIAEDYDKRKESVATLETVVSALHILNQDELLRRATEHLTLGSNSPKLFTLIGQQELKKGRLKEAKAFFNEAVNGNPKNAHALYLLGETYFRLGNKKNAIRYYNYALQLGYKHEPLFRRVSELTTDIPKKISYQRALLALALSSGTNGASISTEFAKIAAKNGDNESARQLNREASLRRKSEKQFHRKKAKEEKQTRRLSNAYLHSDGFLNASEKRTSTICHEALSQLPKNLSAVIRASILSKAESPSSSVIKKLTTIAGKISFTKDAHLLRQKINSTMFKDLEYQHRRPHLPY